jgi:hypothetical protein
MFASDLRSEALYFQESPLERPLRGSAHFRPLEPAWPFRGGGLVERVFADFINLRYFEEEVEADKFESKGVMTHDQGEAGAKATSEAKARAWEGNNSGSISHFGRRNMAGG